jgi:MFS family permease
MKIPLRSENFWELLRHPRLSKIYAVRWSGQLTDGIFQSALASFVLFSPERQANALTAAVGFAVVLLPYSLIGPFVGTILDRVSRQRAMLIANTIRSIDLLLIATLIFSGKTGVELTIAVLITFGIARLILAGLSAGLPLAIEARSLVGANALAVTAGSVALVIGGGLGLQIRRLLDHFHDANHADAYLVIAAAIGYAIAALLTLRLKRTELGPLPHEMKTASLSQGLTEMFEGYKFLRKHRDAAFAILATAIHRGGLTALTLSALLLERNTFHNPSDPEAGLAGLGFAFAIAGAGLVVGAVCAPYLVNLVGRHRVIRYGLITSAITLPVLALYPTRLTLFIPAFFASACGQALKVTSDALVQSKIDDYFRGRVFAVYDVSVNGAIVAFALFSALVLPASGKSLFLPFFISAIYLLVGITLLNKKNFKSQI